MSRCQSSGNYYGLSLGKIHLCLAFAMCPHCFLLLCKPPLVLLYPMKQRRDCILLLVLCC